MVLDFIYKHIFHIVSCYFCCLVLVSEQDIERWKKREMELAQLKPKPTSKLLNIMHTHTHTHTHTQREIKRQKDEIQSTEAV